MKYMLDKDFSYNYSYRRWWYSSRGVYTAVLAISKFSYSELPITSKNLNKLKARQRAPLKTLETAYTVQWANIKVDFETLVCMFHFTRREETTKYNIKYCWLFIFTCWHFLQAILGILIFTRILAVRAFLYFELVCVFIFLT